MNFHTLFHICTNLLTQCTQYQILFSAVFLFQVFRLLKVLQKFWKNQIKNQCVGTFRNHLGGARGPPPGTQAPWWRALGAGHAMGVHGPLVALLAAPLRIYLPPAEEIPNIEVFFTDLLS